MDGFFFMAFQRYGVDGDCKEQCDCGGTNPCGEYIFDHRGGEVNGKYFVSRILFLLVPSYAMFLKC